MVSCPEVHKECIALMFLKIQNTPKHTVSGKGALLANAAVSATCIHAPYEETDEWLAIAADTPPPSPMQLWDFELSTVKPVVTHKTGGVRLSCLLFSPSSPVVVCGGDDGVVTVLRTHNIDREYDSVGEQLSRLDETIRANVMKQQPGQMSAN
jgi:hypothetical protein